MEKLSHNDHIDLYRHLAFCTVGGFFGGYAILVHSGIMGNAQTVNLIELLRMIPAPASTPAALVPQCAPVKMQPSGGSFSAYTLGCAVLSGMVSGISAKAS